MLLILRLEVTRYYAITKFRRSHCNSVSEFRNSDQFILIAYYIYHERRFVRNCTTSISRSVAFLQAVARLEFRGLTAMSQV